MLRSSALRHVAVLALMLGAAGCTFSNSAPECRVAPTYVARYTALSQSASCLPADLINGELLGATGWSSDAGVWTVALRPQSVAEAYASGRRDSEDLAGSRTISTGDSPSVALGGQCTVSNMSSAVQSYPQVTRTLGDGGSETLPAWSIAYDWSEVVFAGTPSANGAVFTATLRRTSNNCSANYAVAGISPVVPCSRTRVPKDPDADCQSLSLVDGGFLVPTGANAALKLRCDGVLGACVLDESFDDIVSRP